MNSLRWKSCALVTLLLAGAALATVPAAAQVRCLPTCNEADGRFMAIAGSNLITLSDTVLDLSVSVPAGASSFQIGIFDGDGRGVDGSGIPHWDTGAVTATYDYTLYADPLGNATGTTLIELQPGSPSVLSTAMPDNAWIDFTVNTGPEAQTPSGNYFYRLSIQLTTPTLTVVNAFKVRTTASISGVTLDPTAQPFSYIANATSLTDIRIIYPSYPDLAPTTYDGDFTFFFDVPVSQSEISLWDGDYDRGKFDGTESDTDDPDTPGAPFLPAWATDDALAEGIPLGLASSTGNPPDDRSGASTGIYLLKTPSVEYDLIFPDGQTFLNPNPSGNQEWEQFKISTAPFDAALMDYSTTTIPGGTYELRARGVDMQNLNALLLPFRVLCVDEEGVPCIPLRPYLIGDTVFYDTDGDGTQDAGEPGIPGVVVNQRDSLGALVASATTGADGTYSFPAEAFQYKVEVAAANFNAGGALEGYATTTGNERTETVVADNVLTYDFGYRGTAALGNRVWEDVDGDGVQDPGEAGLNGVIVELVGQNGVVIATYTTTGDGEYWFDSLAAGTYTIRIVSSTVPSDLVPSFDLDGTGTAHVAIASLAGGQARTDVDFGYRYPAPTNPGTGTIGYWKNHAEAWPVSQITAGGVTYTKTQAIALMGTPSKGDKTYDLFKQLVATKLNLLIGNDSTCVNATVSSADAWLAANPIGSGVKGSSPAWSTGDPLHGTLDAYNNGELCAPHRG